MHLTLHSPTTALSSAGNKQQGGAFLFGYFILGKQNKVTRQEAKRMSHLTQLFSRITLLLICLH
jgi:hypothetical protein